jgi:flagellar motor protein MotB
VTVGDRPVVDQTEDGDDPVDTNYHRAKSGDGVGIGPIADDMDQDDRNDPTARGQSGRRQAKGPGGPMSEQRDGNPLVRQPGEIDLQAALKLKEKTMLEQAAQQIRNVVQADPALADLSKQLTVDMTPDGMRIQIMDEVKLPMFAMGSAAPNDRTKQLIQKIVPVLMKLNKSISIAGYTDSTPFAGQGRSNWDLSTERANTTRRRQSAHFHHGPARPGRRYRQGRGRQARRTHFPTRAIPTRAIPARVISASGISASTHTDRSGPRRRRARALGDRHAHHRRIDLPAHLRLRQLHRVGRQPGAAGRSPSVRDVDHRRRRHRHAVHGQ